MGKKEETKLVQSKNILVELQSMDGRVKSDKKKIRQKKTIKRQNEHVRTTNVVTESASSNTCSSVSMPQPLSFLPATMSNMCSGRPRSRENVIRTKCQKKNSGFSLSDWGEDCFLDEDKIGIRMVREVNGIDRHKSFENEKEEFYRDYWEDEDDFDGVDEDDEDYDHQQVSVAVHSKPDRNGRGQSDDRKNSSTTLSSFLTTDASLAISADRENSSRLIGGGDGSTSMSTSTSMSSICDNGDSSKPSQKGTKQKNTNNVSSKTKNRRLTRGMARGLDEERAHLGLSVLVSAVHDIEEQESTKMVQQGVSGLLKADKDRKNSVIAEQVAQEKTNLNKNNNASKNAESKPEKASRKLEETLESANENMGHSLMSTKRRKSRNQNSACTPVHKLDKVQKVNMIEGDGKKMKKVRKNLENVETIIPKILDVQTSTEDNAHVLNGIKNCIGSKENSQRHVANSRFLVATVFKFGKKKKKKRQEQNSVMSVSRLGLGEKATVRVTRIIVNGKSQKIPTNTTALGDANIMNPEAIKAERKEKKKKKRKMELKNSVHEKERPVLSLDSFLQPVEVKNKGRSPSVSKSCKTTPFKKLKMSDTPLSIVVKRSSKKNPQSLEQSTGETFAGDQGTNSRPIKAERNSTDDQNDPEFPDKSKISLSLLDWRRRQQWAPNSNSSLPGTEDEFDEATSAQLNMVRSDIDACLPSWEAVNPNPGIPKQPSTLEPPRQRHRDKTYAVWCSKLVNCLGSSGRNMAHHEFFYSDIDRAWFNFNEFHADLEKLGIPSNVKLTRSEWGFVRRRIPNRPRRFSQRFISSQLNKLKRYRKCVQEIQARPDLGAIVNFGYEVPAPIKVGATVTAYNKKARMLQRGVVLFRDVKNHGYHIQFERKEFGCELCPDIEVSSHGLPEIIVPSSEVAFDGTYIGSFADPHRVPGSLPYGTSYGPLTDFHRELNLNTILHAEKLDMQNRSVARRLNSQLDDSGKEIKPQQKTTATVYPSGNTVTSCSLPDLISSKEEQKSIIETVAERETLVKLIGLFDTLIERKKMLLVAMEKMHIIMEEHQKNISQDHFSRKVVREDTSHHAFQEHYAWIQANISMTNQSIEAALVHLQVMYSKCYSGGPLIVTEESQKQRFVKNQNVIREKCCADSVGDVISFPWASAVIDGTVALGKVLADNCDLGKYVPERNTNPERLHYIQNLLALASSLILSSDICIDLIEDQDVAGCLDKIDAKMNGSMNTKDGKSIVHSGAMRRVLCAVLERFRPSEKYSLGERASNIENMQEYFFQELMEAVAMLQSELDTAKAKEIV